MPNIPYPVGTRLSVRLTHIFEMKDGKIVREIEHSNLAKHALATALEAKRKIPSAFLLATQQKQAVDIRLWTNMADNGDLVVGGRKPAGAADLPNNYRTRAATVKLNKPAAAGVGNRVHDEAIMAQGTPP